MNRVEAPAPIEDNVTAEVGATQVMPDVNDPMSILHHDINLLPRLKPEEEEVLIAAVRQEIQAKQILENNGELNQEEESHLRDEIQKGKAARNILIERNLMLAISLANAHKGQGVRFLDLIQEGSLGLMRAAEKYDPTKYKNKFSTYAYYAIHRHIHRALDEKKESGFRISRYGNDILRQQIERIVDENNWSFWDLSNEMVSEIADRIGRSPQRVLSLINAKQTIRLLSETYGDDGDGCLEEFIVCPDEEITTVVERSALRQILESALEGLTAREEKILRLRFGLLGEGESFALEEIGERFGLTRERVRQIINGAIEKLQGSPQIGELHDFHGE